MAAIQNLEVVVDVDISKALAKLTELQDELREVARAIDRVDLRGAEGIDVSVNVENIDTELGALKAKLEAFEKANSISIGVRGLGRTVAGSGGSSGGPGGGMGGRLGRLFPNLENFRLRMSDLHNLLASFVPLLVVVIGTIPALVTALVTLAGAALGAAAALGAIAGFGALGMGLQGGQFSMDRLADAWEDIRDSFIEAFAPLAERLQPLFEDALDGLERFFNAIAGEGDVLMQLTDNARAFGRWVTEFVPIMLRGFGAMAEAFDDVFGNIGTFLNEEFINILRDLTEATLEALPAISEMLMLIGRAIPALIQMSIGFTEVLNVVMKAIGAFFTFLDVLGIGPQWFARFTGALLVAVTALSLWNTSLLVGARRALVTFGTQILAAIRRLLGYSASAVVATAASYGLATALLAVVGILGVLAVIVGAGLILDFADQFDILSTKIDGATESLREFDKISGRANSDMNPYRGPNSAPRSGAADPAGSTTVNIGTTGDRETDKAAARTAAWRTGRTTGSGR